MNAAGTILEFAISVLFVAACCIGACILAERARATDLPGPEPVGAGLVCGALTSRAGEQFLAAPVISCDETALDLGTWRDRDPIHAYAWEARQYQRDWLAVARAQAARTSGRRIAEGIGSRRVVASQRGLIAAIRASYAELNVEDTWADLVAAISEVFRGAA